MRKWHIYENNLPNKTEKYHKVDLSNLKKYFTDNALKIFAKDFVEYKGEYYSLSEDYFMEFVASSSIFGQVDQGLRTLTIVNYSNTKINATGLYKSEHSDSDKKPHNISFVKENGIWLIDYFD